MDRFEREVMRLLAARGVTLDANGSWVREGGDLAQPVTDDQIRFLNESGPKNTINAPLKLQWVENFSQVVAVLVQEGVTAPWPYQAMFWIRLHGILVDLWKELHESFRVFDVDPKSGQQHSGSYLDLAFQVFSAIEQLKSALTPDELVYADYRRHTEAHPTQKSYDVRWSSKKSGIVDTREVPTLGREFSVAELSEMTRRVLTAHPNEPSIAVAFARRVQGPTVALLTAVRGFHSPG